MLYFSSMVKRVKFPPPSAEQTKLVHLWISKGAIPSCAAARVGVPKAAWEEWVRMGAAGAPGYKEFVESLDTALVTFQCALLDLISKSAFEKGNVNSATWLYGARFLKKEQALEDAATKGEQAQVVFARQASDDEVMAAEVRALAAEGDPAEISPTPTFVSRTRSFGLDS